MPVNLQCNNTRLPSFAKPSENHHNSTSMINSGKQRGEWELNSKEIHSLFVAKESETLNERILRCKGLQLLFILCPVLFFRNSAQH